MAGKQHPDGAQARREKRMAEIDALPSDLRALVHAYGWAVVRTCMDLGVTKAKHIRHLVERILDDLSPTRGSYSQQGIRTEVSRTPTDGGDA